MTLKSLYVYVHGIGLKILFLFIYRPGSNPVSETFFNEFSHLIERISPHSSVLIVGDVNIHLYDVTDANAIKFQSLLSNYDLNEHAKQQTHAFGHQLDAVITHITSLVQGVDVISSVSYSTAYRCR
jgi:hypothetical protein